MGVGVAVVTLGVPAAGIIPRLSLAFYIGFEFVRIRVFVFVFRVRTFVRFASSMLSLFLILLFIIVIGGPVYGCFQLHKRLKARRRAARQRNGTINYHGDGAYHPPSPARVAEAARYVA